MYIYIYGGVDVTFAQVNLVGAIIIMEPTGHHSRAGTELFSLLLIYLFVYLFVCLCSSSDLSVPITELVRMVKLYSTPWETKSAALKKLHEDYEK